MRRSPALMAAVLILGWSGCIIINDDDAPFSDCLDGRGNIVSTVYELSPFNEIELLGDVELILSQGPVPNVELRAYENLLDEVLLDVNGDRLIISSRRCINYQDRPKLLLTNPNFKKISNSGATNISGDNTLAISSLSIDILGSGDISLALQADNLDVLLTGSGDLELTGSADVLKMSITGSGDFLGFGLTSRQAEILLTGSGDAEVFVEDALKATITGSGSVFFKGHPTLTTTLTGSGEVVDRN
ncbi:MAG: DUF2807 domain-containing protein [Lewinellaceae bacterium]|nr:DUF2807 domain-containing protein [Lewinellaceae bacterium]